MAAGAEFNRGMIDSTENTSDTKELSLLRNRVRTLTEENELLRERSEDLLLLKRIAETIEAQDTVEKILSVGLEQISCLKRIPVCACCSVSGDRIQVLGSHLGFSTEQLPREALEVPPDLIRVDGPESLFFSRTQAAEAGLRCSRLPGGITPEGFLIVPFKSRQIETGFFLFGTDSATAALEGMSTMLAGYAGLVTSRMDKLGLLQELQELNRYLDRKVDSRTRELVEANQSLQKEIGDRRRAELALENTEARFRLLIENAGDGVLLHDMDGHLLDVNQRACDSLGYTRVELLRLSIPDIDTDYPPERIRRIAESMKPGDAITLEGNHRRKDGKAFPVEIRLGALEMSGHQVFVALVRDMTERRKLEAQLQHSQKMEAVGRLAGGVAHDFNNLLSGIIGYSELVLGRLGENNRVRPHIESIHRSGKRAADLTRQLLSFSRKQVLETEVANLNTIIDSIALMLERLIGEHIEIRICKNQVSNILADPGQIEQVLVNLAVNARDAMPDGGSLRIETREEIVPDSLIQRRRETGPGTYVVLTVTDTGTGMSPETQARVFEPFFTTKDIDKGTGLGLSMVYGIVKQHHGYIQLHSEEGKGTTFDVYLPACSDGRCCEEEDAVPGTMAGGTETVLVVDDEEDIRKLVRDVLTPLGYRVLDAASGDDALRIIEDGSVPIDLMLTDIVMPRMTGIQLAEKARAVRPSLRAIFMSGYAEDIVYMGTDDRDTRPPLLSKPLLPHAISERVRSALNEVPLR